MEGLKLSRRTKLDLIITDLVMPEMEGFEVLMNVKNNDPPAKIIVMSGGVRGMTVDFLEIARRLGAAGVLAKPFSTDALVTAIDALLPAENGSNRARGDATAT
jgi:CheY-like chemotaxis protein